MSNYPIDKRKIVAQTADFVKTKLAGDSSGHDWWHIYRVWKLAVKIAKREKADLFVVELAALLHDIADWKFNNGDLEASSRLTKEWLEKLGVEPNIIEEVGEIIRDVSFKGAGVETKMKTIEGMAVQDADRLDALGAMGISRTFAYGGSRGREIYDPTVPAELHQTFEQYKNKQTSSINHFYEKLLLLKDLMNTAAGKKMARRRHKFLEKFLREFFQEWEGKI